MGSGDSLVVEHHTPDQKVLGLSPGRSGGRISFSRPAFSADCYFSIHSTPVLLQ